MATQSIGRVAMIVKGEYSSTTTYNRLDIVTYNGSSYCALDTVIGQDPTDESKWLMVAEKGSKGDTGATGPKGATGATGKGISYITKGSSSGKIDTYIITYSDGTTYEYQVYNGDGSSWDEINGKPFSTVDTDNSFDVTSNKLQLKSQITDKLSVIENIGLTVVNGRLCQSYNS